MKFLTLIFVSLILFMSCDKTYVTEIRTDEHNFTYMYFDQYDFDGQIGTKSDIIVVNADNLRNANSGARQIAQPGEFEEDFDNYVDDYGNPITVDNQYLSDHCWGRGDFSVAVKDVTGDGMTEQVLGTMITPSSDCSEPSCQPEPFASAVAVDLGSVNGELYLANTYDNVKISGNPDPEDMLRWLTNTFHIPVGGKVTLWADEGQTITIKHNHSSTDKILTKSGENEVLNSGEFMVLKRNDYGYGYTEVNRSTVDAAQFFSRPFNITDDVSIRLEDLYLETGETVKMEVFITEEDGSVLGDGTPVFSGELTDGLNVRPPDDTKGFYSIDISIPDPIYFVRFKFVFTVVDTDGEPSGVWIDGFHVEGSADLNTGSCEYNSLPIEITDFYAEKDGDMIHLYIETATEIIADYMEFHGSKDAKNWTKIKHTIPCDNSSMGSRYHLIYNTLDGSLVRQ